MKSFGLYGGVYTLNELEDVFYPLVGLRVGRFVTDQTALGASADLAFVDGTAVLGVQSQVYLVMDSNQPIRPVLTLGIGGVTFFRDGRTVTRGAGTFGAGLRLAVSEKTWLRVELNDRLYWMGRDARNDFHLIGGMDFAL